MTPPELRDLNEQIADEVRKVIDVNGDSAVPERIAAGVLALPALQALTGGGEEPTRKEIADAIYADRLSTWSESAPLDAASRVRALYAPYLAVQAAELATLRGENAQLVSQRDGLFSEIAESQRTIATLGAAKDAAERALRDTVDALTDLVRQIPHEQLPDWHLDRAESASLLAERVLAPVKETSDGR